MIDSSKIIQIAAVWGEDYPVLYALCSDGSLWLDPAGGLAPDDTKWREIKTLSKERD